MNFLGIDFGLRKMGLAFSEGNFIRLLGVVWNSKKVFFKIIEICKENNVGKIIVGLPRGKLLPLVRSFSRELESKSGLPVEFQDETLTTRDAIAKMIEGGVKKKRRKKLEDAAAAACILQGYLARKEAEEDV